MKTLGSSTQFLGFDILIDNNGRSLRVTDEIIRMAIYFIAVAISVTLR